MFVSGSGANRNFSGGGGVYIQKCKFFFIEFNTIQFTGARGVGAKCKILLKYFGCYVMSGYVTTDLYILLNEIFKHLDEGGSVREKGNEKMQ